MAEFTLTDPNGDGSANPWSDIANASPVDDLVATATVDDDGASIEFAWPELGLTREPTLVLLDIVALITGSGASGPEGVVTGVQLSDGAHAPVWFFSPLTRCSIRSDAIGRNNVAFPSVGSDGAAATLLTAAILNAARFISINFARDGIPARAISLDGVTVEIR